MKDAKCMTANAGDMIQIISMEGEPDQAGKAGTVQFIDGIGQIHGTWSGLAIIPEKDEFKTIKKGGIKS